MPGTAGTPAFQRSRKTVAIGFVTGMLSGLAAHAVDRDKWLDAAGIDPEVLQDPGARVPIASYVALYNEIVRALDDEGFGLFSTPLRLGTFEFLCRSVISSRSLEEALARKARFLRVVLPELRLRVWRESSAARIEISETRRLRERTDDPSRVFAFEWLLRLLHGLASWMVGRELSLDSVAFPYPRPAHAADYGLIYTEHSSFDSASLVATLNASLLDLPIRRDDEALSGFLEEAPGKLIVLYRRDREMVHRVRELVAKSLPRSLTLNEAARALHLSPRTLHRRLQDEGSSLRAIKDAVRRDLALSLLAKTTQPVAKVAAELGYSEPSAFFRAFQGWTGVGPSRYRKRLA